MSEQCPKRAFWLRCLHPEGHDGNHRAEFHRGGLNLHLQWEGPRGWRCDSLCFDDGPRCQRRAGHSGAHKHSGWKSDTEWSVLL